MKMRIWKQWAVLLPALLALSFGSFMPLTAHASPCSDTTCSQSVGSSSISVVDANSYMVTVKSVIGPDIAAGTTIDVDLDASLQSKPQDFSYSFEFQFQATGATLEKDFDAIFDRGTTGCYAEAIMSIDDGGEPGTVIASSPIIYLPPAPTTHPGPTTYNNTPTVSNCPY